MLTGICEPNWLNLTVRVQNPWVKSKSDGSKRAESKPRRTNDCILRTLYTFWDAVYERMSFGLYVVREAVYEMTKHGYSWRARWKPGDQSSIMI